MLGSAPENAAWNCGAYRRNQLKADLPGTLAAIRNLGFTDIETASFYGHSAAEFRQILDTPG